MLADKFTTKTSVSQNALFCADSLTCSKVSMFLYQLVAKLKRFDVERGKRDATRKMDVAREKCEAG